MQLAISPAKRWPSIIVTVLVLQMAFGVWMARVAGNDPHHAVEPDYYARAVSWDSTMAQSRRDQALGWRASAEIVRSEGRTATLRITITDSLGSAVTADAVRADALAISHAATITRVTLSPDHGAYIGQIDSAAAGLWEMQLRAVRGADLFTAKLRAELR
jgi:nitrogen fixation protein FixH